MEIRLPPTVPVSAEPRYEHSYPRERLVAPGQERRLVMQPCQTIHVCCAAVPVEKHD